MKAREITPDVVLADVVMPGKSGYEVCEAIKQDPALAHIPVLLLTGTFEAFDEARATAAGANGQITKPFEAQALVARVSEVMNAPPVVASQPPPPPVESATGEYDFVDADVTTLSAGDSSPSISADVSSIDQTPMIETDGPNDAHLFGAPGDGATDELDTQGGGLALGEAVAPDRLQDVPQDVPDDDATIAILPDSPPPLPPSMGDPLVGFENDLDLAELSAPPATPPAPPAEPTPSLDLDSALDAVPSDPGATIVAEIDDTNATTFPNDEAGRAAVIDDEFDDLTVHTPSAAIDQDVASAPSPVAIGSIPVSAPADATVVANLDVSLAEPAPETPAPPPLDLGPANVSPPDLDFAFDVSEQVPAADLSDSMGESFSSLMDISESQILAGPPADPPYESDSIATETVVDDSFAAGYDVSTSDLVTAPPTHETPVMSAPETAMDDSISMDDSIDANLDLQQSLQADIPDVPQEDLLLHEEEPIANPAATTLPPEDDELELGVPTPTTSSPEQRIADLSPLVEQRIQETLEKVAWEAFSDLSESIVKQVIGRIEQIAWEVIPQMAETLVREEIRKMKGEKD